MRLEARLSYALIGLVQATGYAGGLDYGSPQPFQTKRVSFESGYRMVCTFTMLVLPWVLSGMPAVITTVSPEAI